MDRASVFGERRPRYQIVAENLLSAIQRGSYPVGSALPTEQELCAQFNVSRHTVREAVRLIEQMGLISRHQGIGTRVERNSIHQHYVQTLASISDLWQYVNETRRRVLDIRDVTARDVDVPLPGDAGAPWRMLEGLRYVQNEAEPIAWTQIFLPKAYGAVLDDASAEPALVYSLVEQKFGVVTQSVRQEISAVEIAKPVATALNVRPKSVGLAMLRQYVGKSGEIFELTWSVHPADRYRYSMEMVRSYGSPRD
jgi:DNA-binding GntR family transcriptional regulator